MNNFNDLYQQQIGFQLKILKKFGYGDYGDMVLPKDNPEICSFHIQQLISEIGEVLSADKRWKTYRNEHIDLVNKKEEIADCFIVLMNIAIFSGMNANELFEEILGKIENNFDRISKNEK